MSDDSDNISLHSQRISLSPSFIDTPLSPNSNEKFKDASFVHQINELEINNNQISKKNSKNNFLFPFDFELSQISKKSVNDSESNSIFSTNEYPNKFMIFHNYSVWDSCDDETSNNMVVLVLQLIEKHLKNEKNILREIKQIFLQYFIMFYSHLFEKVAFSKDYQKEMLESHINCFLMELDYFIDLYIVTLSAYYNLDYICKNSDLLISLSNDVLIKFVCSLLFEECEVYEILYEFQRRLDQEKEEKFRRFIYSNKKIKINDFFKYLKTYKCLNFLIDDKMRKESSDDDFQLLELNTPEDKKFVFKKNFELEILNEKSLCLTQNHSKQILIEKSIELFKNIKFTRCPYNKIKIILEILKIYDKHSIITENKSIFDEKNLVKEMVPFFIFLTIHSQNMSILTDFALIIRIAKNESVELLMVKGVMGKILEILEVWEGKENWMECLKEN